MIGPILLSSFTNFGPIKEEKGREETNGLTASSVLRSVEKKDEAVKEPLEFSSLGRFPLTSSDLRLLFHIS